MKIRILYIFLLLLIVHFPFSQGLIIDEATNQEYKKIRAKNTSLVANNKSLPETTDLSKYLPNIIDQKKYGTCVGVSSTYYLRTLLEAQRLGITDKSKIDQLSYSPSYLFNAVKDSTNTNCMKGINITKALDFLKKEGVINYKQLPYPNCNNHDHQLKPKHESKIMDYIKVFGAGANNYENPVELTKKALFENSPVLVGFMMSPSFDQLQFRNSLWPRFKAFLGFELSEEEDYRLWKLEKDEKLLSGHCVCIVGYDNKKYGGAFKVVNSYGEWWGDNGFFWIKYTDFPKLAMYCFQAYLEPSLTPNETELSAQVVIKDGNIENFEIPFSKVTLEKNDDQHIESYALLYPQNTGSLYNFEANIGNQCYLYLIGKNEASPYTPLLFPNADSTSELIGANSKFVFPSPEWNKEKTKAQARSYKLVAPLGQENWLFLFSKTKLNINEYITKINTGQGNFNERLIAAFGNELVPNADIIYSDKKIAFQLKKGHKGNIVPILITFDHMELVESL